MSHVSQARKVKREGVVRELKLVQTITRRGVDTLKGEEVHTPRHAGTKASPSKARTQSSSPAKRLKLHAFDAEPVPSSLDGPDDYEKRQTLVFIPL